MPQLPFYYENGIEWTGENKGLLSVTGLPSLQVATPPEFGGHEGQCLRHDHLPGYCPVVQT
jgi:hypothetical protein